MSLYLCITGIEKFFNEKDLIKFIRKSFGQGKQSEDQKDEVALPLKAVSKKRGSPFAFLEFSDKD
jgi:hypothetical protein